MSRLDLLSLLRFYLPVFRICPQCKKDSLFVEEPVYDGFKKTGDRLRCTACGCLTGKNSVPAPAAEDPLAGLFGEEESGEETDLFDVEAETSRLCRKCRHYVIHPFTQRCGLHECEVSATDSCDQFESGEPA